METRNNEVRYFTSKPEEMLDKYTVREVVKKWVETHYDKDTGEPVAIERNNLLIDKGVLIDQELLQSIRFWIEEGSIKEIEVSNQRRMAYPGENNRYYPFKAQVSVISGSKRKKVTFLLYALSVSNALEIISDYVELNFSGSFYILKVEAMEFCLILVDKLKTATQRNVELDVAYLNDEISMEEYLEEKIDADYKESEKEDDSLELKFYQIGAKVIKRLPDIPDEEYDTTFIVKTFSATRANLIIEKYLRDEQENLYKKFKEQGKEEEFVRKEIFSFIEESKILNIGDFIPRQFSEAYGR